MLDAGYWMLGDGGDEEMSLAADVYLELLGNRISCIKFPSLLLKTRNSLFVMFYMVFALNLIPANMG